MNKAGNSKLLKTWGFILTNRRPVLVLLLVCLSYLFIIQVYAVRFNGNLTGFACFGDYFPAPEVVNEKTFVLKNSDGYDGQFFFLMAHDPFMTGPVSEYLDAPGYRYQRILYPWLVALLALGQRELIPFTLLAVNVAAVLLGCVFVMLLARKYGASPWVGLAYGFLCGLQLGVLRDLAEPLALGLVVGGVYFFVGKKPLKTALFLAGAVLAKELMLLITGALAFQALFLDRDRRMFAWLCLSVLPLALWGAVIYLVLGEVAYVAGGKNIGPPLAALWVYLVDLVTGVKNWRDTIYGLVFLAVTLWTMVLAAREILRRRDALSLPFLIWAVFPLFLTSKVWVEPWSYGRVIAALSVFLVLNFVKTRDRLYLPPLIGHAALFWYVIIWQRVI